VASQPGDAPSHQELPPKRDLAALRRMASVQAHELLLMFDQLMPLDRCRLSRSSPRQTYKSRLGPEAIGGTIRTCAGPAADTPIGRSTPAARRAACRASTAQAGCREPPDLLGLQKRTGGKVFLVQDYKSYGYKLKISLI
jgi:hypothetical protein